ncbi:MAG: peptidyl-alpha-hydroxyglycine alpha-amidating lyase family protein [Mycobacterium sp.]
MPVPTRSTPIPVGGYEPDPDWPAFPVGVSYGGAATSVAVDSKDRVYVFNRGPIPVVVLNPDGSVVDLWGTGDFVMPHGVSVDAQDNIWAVDLKHTVQKFSIEGRGLLTIGDGTSSAPFSGVPFNRPTDAIVHPLTGEIFVTDGYRNAAVHRFAPDGQWIKSWGAPGSDPGEFSLPHGLCFVGDDRILICDRENFRLQLFTLDGQFLGQWHSYYPQCLRSVPIAGGQTAILVGEGPRVRYQRDVPNLGCRVRILDESGQEIARIGTGKWGFDPDAFVSIHGVAVDSQGDVYVAETPYATIVHYYGESAPEPEPISLRKWRRKR